MHPSHSFLTRLTLGVAVFSMLVFSTGWSQESTKDTQPKPASQSPADASGVFASPNFGTDQGMKKIDDLSCYQKLGDIADFDKFDYSGPPSAHVKNKKAPGAINPLILHAYTFIPKRLDRSRKQPLIVFVHQGVHSSLDTSIDAHLVREVIEQGYTVVATDCRGSTGYSKGLYENIDYGGPEGGDSDHGTKRWVARPRFVD